MSIVTMDNSVNHVTKIYQKKTAGAVILQTVSEITEKEQPFCNIYRITICQVQLGHFTNQAQGDSRKWKLNQTLILNNLFKPKTKCKRCFTKKN